MDRRRAFYENNVRFEHDPRPFRRRLLITGAAVVLFTLLWVFVPHGVLYWLLLPVLILLVWLASHGWRWALNAMERAIGHLQQRYNGGV